MNILIGIGIALSSALITYLIIRPKIKQKEKLDLAILSTNYENQIKKEQTQKDLEILLNKKDEVEHNLNFMQNQAANIEEHNKQLARVSYDKHFELMQSKLADSALRESMAYEASINDCKNEYLNILKEASLNLSQELKDKQQKINELKIKFADLHQNRYV